MTVKIKANERAFFVGTTGSGKTVLAKYLLNYSGDRIFVIDPKHTFEHKNEDFEYAKNLPIFRKEFKIIYRPTKNDDRDMANILTELYKRGNVLIYVDELATTAKFFPATIEILEDISRTGRERYISLWCATQRPRHVPVAMLTESEVWFVFLLRDPRDRRHMQGYVGEEVNEQIPMYHFWYARPGMASPELMTLDLEENELKEVEKTYQLERR